MKLKYNLYIFWAVIGLCCISCSNKDDDHIPPAIQEPEKPAAPTTKKCPYCMSEISIDATRCPNCTSSLIDVDAKELS